ncbi:MAG: hypothetical protein RL172_2072, partial [Bacteroidota bacterium]
MTRKINLVSLAVLALCSCTKLDEKLNSTLTNSETAAALG